MREFTAPLAVEIAPDANLVQPVLDHASATPDRAMFAYRNGDVFYDVTAAQFVEHMRAIARGLIALGVKPGQRVSIMSRTRFEFTLLQYAILAAGATTVPIYETDSAEQVEWILTNSDVVALLVENATLRAEYDKVAKKAKTTKHVFTIDEGGIDEVVAKGESVDPGEVDARVNGIKADDLCDIIYTSGTTGRPKGCALSHGNMRWTTGQALSNLPELFRPGDSTLLFLPLAHSFAQLIQFGCVEAGVRTGYATSIPQLSEELQMFQPSFVLSVPRVFEKVYNTATQKAHAEGKGAIFEKAVQTAIDYSRATERGGKAGLALRTQHTLFDKLVYGKLRHALGGKVRYAVSGGAALGERLGHFFNGVGVTVLEGYGLTETCAPATVNRPGMTRIGSVGPPLPGVTIRIADDGEVLIKGGNVFQGYLNDEQATRESIDDEGFYHSGDIGELDSDGFLRITGRKKELIVTAGGKNVAPAVLEDRLRADALISQAMVVGDGKPFIAALITVDPEEFPRWAQEHNKTGAVADLTNDPDLLAEVQDAVNRANNAVSRAESIRKFSILPDDFTIEGGELTPTLKVKRRVVEDRYADAIEALYAGAPE